MKIRIGGLGEETGCCIQIPEESSHERKWFLPHVLTCNIQWAEDASSHISFLAKELSENLIFPDTERGLNSLHRHSEG